MPTMSLGLGGVARGRGALPPAGRPGAPAAPGPHRRALARAGPALRRLPAGGRPRGQPLRGRRRGGPPARRRPRVPPVAGLPLRQRLHGAARGRHPGGPDRPVAPGLHGGDLGGPARRRAVRAGLGVRGHPALGGARRHARPRPGCAPPSSSPCCCGACGRWATGRPSTSSPARAPAGTRWRSPPRWPRSPTSPAPSGCGGCTGSTPASSSSAVVACFGLLAEALLGVAVAGERSFHPSWWVWHGLIVAAFVRGLRRRAPGVARRAVPDALPAGDAGAAPGGLGARRGPRGVHRLHRVPRPRRGRRDAARLLRGGDPADLAPLPGRGGEVRR